MSIVGRRLYDTGDVIFLLLSGTFATVLGMMMTSICMHYWQFFSAQGILVGVGAGLLFAPSDAIMSQYFAKSRAFAIGIASLGGSAGMYHLNVFLSNSVFRRCPLRC